MSTAVLLDLPTVTRVKTSSGSHIEPPLDEAWSDAQKLAWHAAVVAADTGLTITVHQDGHLFSVGEPGLGRTGTPYREAWTLLNGINAGAAPAKRAAKAVAMLQEIASKLDGFEDEACELFGGDSPQRLWAWGLNAAIAEALRTDPRP